VAKSAAPATCRSRSRAGLLVRVEATTTRDFNRISVDPLTGSIGAEVGNVDLRDFDDEVIAEIQQAWLDHKVLFFGDQDLTQAQHIAYGQAFGELEVHPFVESAEAHPEIIVLNSTPENFVAAESWHSDVTFRECPPLGSILLGRTIPPFGGDTMWANMELAYDMLSDDVKEQIEGRFAIHTHAKVFGTEGEDAPQQRHPVARTHPVTGRKSLFVNRNFTINIDGMTQQESHKLRHHLYDQATIPELQCRFRWKPNSIAQWDNRCTQHYAVPDYGGQTRRVERVTLIGDRPV
jgi:taurine dioxygenase